MKVITKKKKKILIAGHAQGTCTSFEACILKFLGDYVEVIPWCVGESIVPPTDITDVDLTLVVTQQAYDLCRAHCPPDSPLLVAERVISVNNLDKLLSLEAKSKAYVIGTNYETTTNTVSLLQRMGFSEITFVPCFSGMVGGVQSDIPVAITPGLLHFIPSHITTLIDIGTKEVAISTFSEIMNLLDIPITILNNIANQYIQTILASTRERSLVGYQNEALKKELEAILNTVQEPIVALNEYGRVVVYNQGSEKIFRLPITEAIGSDWRSVIPDSALIQSLETGENVHRQLKFIDEQHYFVNANVIKDSAGKIKGVVATFHPVQEIKELETQVRSELKSRENVARYSFRDIKGSSVELRRTVSLAAKFAVSDLTILLEGESGTGKELFAQAIHNQSSRRNNPFVAINFAAIPDNLAESELFGYEEGAFTGARKGGKPGLFEEAHLGTIFLDEIGSATPEVQNRLLRVLEERQIKRLGSSRNTPVDVRVVAATNIGLEDLVSQKLFRADLYYRLCALPIAIPSLRDRNTDISTLTDYYIKKFPANLNCSPEVSDFFLAYDWPGNIRELQNVVRYLCSVVEPGKTATVADFPPYLLRKYESARRTRQQPEIKQPSGEKEGLPFYGEFQDPGLRLAAPILLREMKQRSAGRKGIGYTMLLQKISEELPGVSEYSVKKWLKILRNMEYVETGKTKQGSFITEKGLALLQALQHAARPAP